MAHEYSEQERQALADKGQALPDGSFPIPDCEALHDAVHAYGRAKPSHRAAVAALIRKRHQELGGCGIELEELD